MRLPTGGTFVTARMRRARAELHDRAARRALGVECAGGAGGGRGGRAAISALAGLALAELGGLHGRGARLAVDGRRRRGAGDRRKLQRQPRLDARDARRCSAHEPGRARSRCSARCANWATASDDYHADLAEPILAARVETALLVGEAMAPLAQALEGQVEIVHVPDAAAALASLDGRSWRRAMRCSSRDRTGSGSRASSVASAGSKAG